MVPRIAQTIPPRIRPERHLTHTGVLVVRFPDGIVIECHHDRVAGTDGDSCFVRLGAPTAGAVRDVRATLRGFRRVGDPRDWPHNEGSGRVCAPPRVPRHRSHLAELARDIEEAAEEYRGVDFDDADVIGGETL